MERDGKAALNTELLGDVREEKMTLMTCQDCEKKDKRIEELERMVQSMAESYDAVQNAAAIDFFQEMGVEI